MPLPNEVPSQLQIKGMQRAPMMPQPAMQQGVPATPMQPAMNPAMQGQVQPAQPQVGQQMPNRNGVNQGELGMPWNLRFGGR